MPPRSPHFRMPTQMPWSPQPNIAPQRNGPHAVRMQLQFLPNVTAEDPSSLGTQTRVSQPIRVDGLVMKTLEFFPGTAPLTKGLIVQGSIISIGNPSPSWWQLFPAVVAPGIVPIVVPDQNALSTHEPSLNAIRIIQKTSLQGPPVDVDQVIVAFSGFWMGPGLWLSRHTPYEG